MVGGGDNSLKKSHGHHYRSISTSFSWIGLLRGRPVFSLLYYCLRVNVLRRKTVVSRYTLTSFKNDRLLNLPRLRLVFVTHVGLLHSARSVNPFGTSEISSFDSYFSVHGNFHAHNLRKTGVVTHSIRVCVRVVITIMGSRKNPLPVIQLNQTISFLDKSLKYFFQFI